MGKCESCDRLELEAARVRLDALATEEQLQEEVERLKKERDDYKAKYEFMVERAANEKLDGYRELGAKCASLEQERDEAREGWQSAIRESRAFFQQSCRNAQERDEARALLALKTGICVDCVGARREGAEAMREAAAQVFAESCREYHLRRSGYPLDMSLLDLAEGCVESLRALPLPGERVGKISIEAGANVGTVVGSAGHIAIEASGKDES